jgi:hypothetical protein
MWLTTTLTLLAAVLATNAVPHFVKGLTKEPFPSLLGPAPAVNVVAGWAMLVAAVVVGWAADVPAHPWASLAAAGAGSLAMALFHAIHGAYGRGA